MLQYSRLAITLNMMECDTLTRRHLQRTFQESLCCSISLSITPLLRQVLNSCCSTHILELKTKSGDKFTSVNKITHANSVSPVSLHSNRNFPPRTYVTVLISAACMYQRCERRRARGAGGGARPSLPSPPSRRRRGRRVISGPRPVAVRSDRHPRGVASSQ